MNIMIVGYNPVIPTLVSVLSQIEKSNIVVVVRKEHIGLLDSEMNCYLMQADIGDPKAYYQANGHEIDVVIAVDDSDASNILTCFLMKDLFNVKVTISLLKNANYMPEKKLLKDSSNLFSFIDHVLCLSYGVSQAIYFNIINNINLGFRPILDDNAFLYSFVLKNTIPNLKSKLKNSECSIISVLREKKILLFSEIDYLDLNDLIYILIPKNKLDYVMELFNQESRLSHKNIACIGRGYGGDLLIDTLSKAFPRVTFIDEDAENIESVMSLYNNVKAIKGNILNQQIEGEANINDMDLVISMSEDDHVNILSSIIAKQANVKNIISVVKSPVGVNVLKQNNIDLTISFYNFVTEKIISAVFSEAINGMQFIMHNRCVVVDIFADKIKDSYIGKKVSHLSNLFEIVTVFSGNKQFLPDKNYILQKTDRLIIVTKYKFINEIISIQKTFK